MASFTCLEAETEKNGLTIAKSWHKGKSTYPFDEVRVSSVYIEYFQMKSGYLNYLEISKKLNPNGYRSRSGRRFSPGIVRRFVV